MVEKIINKLFFKKVVFKVFVVLTFFLGISMFFFMCSNYRNPYYGGWKLKEYDNFIQFVDESLAYDIIHSHQFIYSKYLYDSAFIKQASEKKIFSGSVGNLSSGKYILLEKVYSCDKEKRKNFENEYKFINGHNYSYFTENEYYKDNNISVDCKKAKTIHLAPENYYFWKHDFWAYIAGSFVCIPLIFLILWTALRFIIISPILWIFKKD